jgi:hypothetical protein
MSEPANPEGMRQYAPFPADLADLVDRLRFKPGWRFTLADIVRDPATTHGAAAGGLTFTVLTSGYDAYHPERGEGYRVYHHFPVPAATFNRASWLRWLLDCLLRVELHETCEFFALVTDHAEPEDRCVLCGHQASRHDGRDSTCHEESCASHRFRADPPRVERPFAPTHGPGDDPYVIHEYASETQRRTRFTGEVLNA